MAGDHAPLRDGLCMPKGRHTNRFRRKRGNDVDDVIDDVIDEGDANCVATPMARVVRDMNVHRVRGATMPCCAMTTPRCRRDFRRFVGELMMTSRLGVIAAQ